MKSHQYEFTAKDLLQVIGSILAPAVLFALLMHAGAAARLWPRPVPALDADRTILFHQAEASQAKHDADVLLIGDSSCMMDVSARRLNAAWTGQHQAINLGTLSYLDLPAYASLVSRYVAANPDQLRAVVLLMHPEALRRAAPSEYHVAALNQFHEGADLCPPATAWIYCWLGGHIFHGRFWGRVVPVPLEGSFGRRYGFTKDLWRFLSEHGGSAFDPGIFDPKSAAGNAEYRLSPRLEPAGRVFRHAVPIGVKLIAGITPVPESFATPAYREQHAAILGQWAQWLQADVVLEGLPITWPDQRFASTTHLNETGANEFSDLLAGLLKGYLP